MRIAIISDVHANLAALESIGEPYDLLLCLGDLVDYGPQPREAIHWVRERALKVIRGNHDHALGYAVDCRCAPVMHEASVTTRRVAFATFVVRRKRNIYMACRSPSGWKWRGLRSIWHMPRRREISTITI